MQINPRIALSFALLLLPAPGCTSHSSAVPRTVAVELKTQTPTRVTITGYMDQIMEPFVTRDGHYLLFNNSNNPGTNTDIYFAERQDDFNWKYRGKVSGINTPALEGCATMDSSGRLYFVSTRSYPETLCTIYSGQFLNGVVSDVQIVESISRREAGIVNFDVDISSDGKVLIFVDSRFQPGHGPQDAILVLAHRNGAKFVRDSDSAQLLASVNGSGLVYAPTLSADTLTLYFTRFDPLSVYKAPQIYRSIRPAVDSAFGPPVHLAGLGEYVEGSALSANGNLLYYHRKDGDMFHLYAVPIY